MPLSTTNSHESTFIPEEIHGLRMTRQRQEVYRTLLSGTAHPTAHDVFMQTKDRLPHLSLATVYNCLEAMLEHGVIKQVNFERGPSRYCCNLQEHAHFHDKATGIIYDVQIKDRASLQSFIQLPEGAVIDQVEITIRGKIP